MGTKYIQSFIEYITESTKKSFLEALEDYKLKAEEWLSLEVEEPSRKDQYLNCSIEKGDKEKFYTFKNIEYGAYILDSFRKFITGGEINYIISYNDQGSYNETFLMSALDVLLSIEEGSRKDETSTRGIMKTTWNKYENLKEDKEYTEMLNNAKIIRNRLLFFKQILNDTNNKADFFTYFSSVNLEEGQTQKSVFDAYKETKWKNQSLKDRYELWLYPKKYTGSELAEKLTGVNDALWKEQLKNDDIERTIYTRWGEEKYHIIGAKDGRGMGGKEFEMMLRAAADLIPNEYSQEYKKIIKNENINSVVYDKYNGINTNIDQLFLDSSDNLESYRGGDVYFKLKDNNTILALQAKTELGTIKGITVYNGIKEMYRILKSGSNNLLNLKKELENLFFTNDAKGLHLEKQNIEKQVFNEHFKGLDIQKK